MKNFPVTINGKEFWISRSISVEGFIFTYDNTIKVLANKRGPGCPKEIGKWNCPCGYLDYDETVKQACIREVKEETGLEIDQSLLNFFEFDSIPKGKTQNVSFIYWSCGNAYKRQQLSTAFSEPEEVEEIRWIELSELDKYDWAFEHNYTIMRIALEHLRVMLSEEIIRRFEKQLKEHITLGTDA